MGVLISAAGIAGLSLPLRLRQRGMTPVAVERSRRPRDGGYMPGLADPGLDAAYGGRALRAAGCYRGGWETCWWTISQRPSRRSYTIVARAV